MTDGVSDVPGTVGPRGDGSPCRDGLFPAAPGAPAGVRRPHRWRPGRLVRPDGSRRSRSAPFGPPSPSGPGGSDGLPWPVSGVHGRRVDRGRWPTATAPSDADAARAGPAPGTAAPPASDRPEGPAGEGSRAPPRRGIEVERRARPARPMPGAIRWGECSPGPGPRAAGGGAARLRAGSGLSVRAGTVGPAARGDRALSGFPRPRARRPAGGPHRPVRGRRIPVRAGSGGRIVSSPAACPRRRLRRCPTWDLPRCIRYPPR